jgi:hypothetical protein
MPFLATALGTKVAIAALSLVAIGGGTAVAASAGVLPSIPRSEPTQATPSAGVVDDAPETESPSPTSTDAATPAPFATQGPNAEGPAAFGLCTAYTAGGLRSTSMAYSALARAAQSSAGISAYCAPILAAHLTGAPDGHQESTPRPESTDASHAATGAESSHGKSSSAGSHGH